MAASILAHVRDLSHLTQVYRCIPIRNLSSNRLNGYSYVGCYSLSNKLLNKQTFSNNGAVVNFHNKSHPLIGTENVRDPETSVSPIPSRLRSKQRYRKSNWKTMRRSMTEKYGISSSSDISPSLLDQQLEIQSLSTSNNQNYIDATRSLSNDFFGINEVEQDRASHAAALSKAESDSFEIPQDKDVVYAMHYGHMRLDTHNMPIVKKPGIKTSKVAKEKKNESASSSVVNSGNSRSENNGHRNVNTTVADVDVTETNIYDEQYFGEEILSENGNKFDEKLPKSNVTSQNVFENSKLPLPQGDPVETSLPNKESVSSSDTEHSDNIFDEQYFNYTSQSQSNENLIGETSQSSTTEDVLDHVQETAECSSSHQKIMEKDDEDSNIFDEQYFGGDAANINQGQSIMSISDAELNNSYDVETQTTKSFEQSDTLKNDPTYESAPPMLSSDSSGFDNNHDISTNTSTSYHADNKYLGDRGNNVKSENKFSRNITKLESQTIDEFSMDDSSTIFAAPVTKREEKSRKRPKPNITAPKTAYDLAMNVRLRDRGIKFEEASSDPVTSVSKRWAGAVDSKGFRILKSQVVNLQSVPSSVVIKLLHDSILYEDNDIIAIDKPYGLPSHGGPKIQNSVGKFLPDLAKMKNVDDLFLVHRLDKETTGVMILAKSSKVASRLHSMFLGQQVIKKYWVLTKGVASPTQGIIDIPIAESTVGNRYRMTLQPYYTHHQAKMLLASSKRNGNKQEAITAYRVLDQNDSCALVECRPKTGVKHQIRCHLAFALNTPILGDHKYSHFTKMAPQKLYPDLLQKLGIRQSKVRHLPVHLHAATVILPEFNDGHNIHISARLPKHFLQNMKWLKLKIPS